MNWSEDIGIIHDIILPVLDIAVIAYILYWVYDLIEKTRAIQIIKVIIYMIALYTAAYFLNLTTLLWIYANITPVVLIILAIIYQPELRRAFTSMASRSSGIFRLANKTSTEQIETIINAMQVLSSKGRGALIVFPRRLDVKNIVESGTRIQGDISNALLLTLFDHDTPLHDGAVIISGGKIQSAGCFLPISQQADIRKSFGSRHRAALGMAEDSDAVVLIVSEETGAISLAYNANLYYDLVPETVRRSLIALLNYQDVLPEEMEDASDENE
ncbi:MAG: diadenylate cyclase CdaA [Spirochaetia bacterium]|nr:diadenylate cyclase CdaA [Spirochaetia bacterium]